MTLSQEHTTSNTISACSACKNQFKGNKTGFVCSGCWISTYCDRNCQAAHFREHRKVCQKLHLTKRGRMLQLHNIIALGDEKRLNTEIAEKKLEIISWRERNWNLLCIGAYYCNISATRAILNEEPNLLNHKVEGFMCPLFASVYGGHVLMMDYLLKKGADKDIQDNKGNSALIISSSNGQLDLVKRLVKHHANVDLANQEGMTALMCASKNGKEEIIETLLIEASANCTIVDNDGSSALMIACANLFPSPKCVKLLLTADIDASTIDMVNVDGDTALMIASSKGRPEIVNLLLEELIAKKSMKVAIDYVNFVSKEGNTALMLASYHGSVEICRILVGHGANLLVKNKNGFDAVYFARARCNKNELKFLLNSIKMSNLPSRNRMTL